MSHDYLISLTQRMSNSEKCNRYNISSYVHLDANTLQCDKDVVCHGYNVQSKCEPNKLVKTNQHKQLVSTNVSDIINGCNIDIQNNPNGSITIRNPQQVSPSSIPTFKSINITDPPTNDNHVATKRYVDTKLSGIDNGIFNTGTTQIRLPSTVNSTSCSSGSLIVAGGMAIEKDFYMGGGLFFPNETGIMTRLDFFEEGTLNIIWNNIWDHEISSVFAYQRIGKWVSLMFPYIAHSATKSGIISNMDVSYLPERLQPLYDISIDIFGLDNNLTIPVCVTFFGDNGKINVKPKDVAMYTGIGICGFNTFSISYMAKV